MQQRNKRLMTVGWLSKMAVGDINRDWAMWLRANYEQWDKPESDFDSVTWSVKHTELLRKVRIGYQEAGYQISLERQNTFWWERASGLRVVGTPDLVVVKDGSATVVDAKTGVARGAHKAQVLIYMLLLPQAHQKFAGMRLAGRLVYASGLEIEIHPEEAYEFADHFEPLLDVVDTEIAPFKFPSEGECRFCDISSRDCDERMAPDTLASEDEAAL